MCRSRDIRERYENMVIWVKLSLPGFSHLFLGKDSVFSRIQKLTTSFVIDKVGKSRLCKTYVCPLQSLVLDLMLYPPQGHSALSHWLQADHDTWSWPTSEPVWLDGPCWLLSLPLCEYWLLKFPEFTLNEDDWCWVFLLFKALLKYWHQASHLVLEAWLLLISLLNPMLNPECSWSPENDSFRSLYSSVKVWVK